MLQLCQRDRLFFESMSLSRSPLQRKCDLADKEQSDDAMVKLMRQEPKLVRRPLLKVGDKLWVGGSNAAVEAAIIEAK